MFVGVERGSLEARLRSERDNRSEDPDQLWVLRQTGVQKIILSYRRVLVLAPMCHGFLLHGRHIFFDHRPMFHGSHSLFDYRPTFKTQRYTNPQGDLEITDLRRQSQEKDETTTSLVVPWCLENAFLDSVLSVLLKLFVICVFTFVMLPVRIFRGRQVDDEVDSHWQASVRLCCNKWTKSTSSGN